MDYDFLEEYQLREDSFINSTILDRLPNLKPPVYRPLRYSNSLWSQVAFSGTILFPLVPMSEKEFKESWNISPSEFPDIIQFAKETKKIQFLLKAQPLQYKEFDYLEPILRELSPPLERSALYLKDPKKMDKINSFCNEEIDFLVKFSPEWKQAISDPYFQIDFNYIKETYIWLRYYGLNDVADTIIDNFLVDPKFSYKYSILSRNLILTPLLDPLKANLSLGINTIKEADEAGITATQVPLDDISYPEVGSFLMTKCTCYAESLEACKNLISQYKENDLYNVHAALNHAVVNGNESKILDKNTELVQILDNIWEDNRIKRNATIFNIGIDMTVGTVGYYLIGTNGLLASLGLKVLNRCTSRYIDQFSELIAKKIAQPYMATIYDFKKNINRR